MNTMNDFQFLLDMTGETVLVDNVSRKCILQNAKIGDYEEKYIYTLSSIQRGNIVRHNEKNYLVVSDVTENSVYRKALMRKTNETIRIEQTEQRIVSYNDFGEPIYENVVVSVADVPCIVDKYTFRIDDFAPIRVAENQIIVTMKDDVLNREKFVVNFEFVLYEQNWKVIDVDMTKKGILILTGELNL
ncbi:hypothetical protein GGR02_003483 [Anoxybacillus voinovskiensis]|uniref:Uncharacterized protein n=1 Tax=Anoxybacteroides voinovskiense TaxID=230470 RepID=A0A840E1I0_9BACL|nr:Ig domain-containing protein [Anoxybacillus voinovskiensis]MBB4075629.1 hypothetical protein [Anoxybacillus voinovskiensis]GGJ80520.1 hypothetical protein GCM10008982_32590 [Anoxybacillus voinovskiensis]